MSRNWPEGIAKIDFREQPPNFLQLTRLADPIFDALQTAEERYGIPENFLEIEVRNPQIQ
ncbi:hypothetical protein HK100_011601, partial [Physocladia obscura]